MPQKRTNPEEYIGKRFGRILVISVYETVITYKKSKGYKYMMFCSCDCGNSKVMSLQVLRRGIISCGCSLKDWNRESKSTHGMTKDGDKVRSEYSTWSKLKRRCTNPLDKYYKDYGGRGITVCNEWLDSFEQFYEDMGPRPGKKYSLDRINNNNGYYKENCRWATQSQQMRNTRTTHNIEYNGITKCISAWADEYNINLCTLSNRLLSGWSVEEALTVPVSKGGRPTKSRSTQKIKRNKQKK